jgi:hypothetical protein
VRHRSGQRDVAQSLAANFGLNHFHAAFFTHHTTVFHAFVFSAVALEVLDGPKDARTEETIALGFKRAVVDGFWLLDFTMRPLTDLLRRG